MLGILKKLEVTLKKYISLVNSEFKMAATAKPAIRGQKYFGWLTYSMVGLIDISFKKIGDFQFGSLFVTQGDDLLKKVQSDNDANGINT